MEGAKAGCTRVDRGAVALGRRWCSAACHWVVECRCRGEVSGALAAAARADGNDVGSGGWRDGGQDSGQANNRGKYGIWLGVWQGMASHPQARMPKTVRTRSWLQARGGGLDVPSAPRLVRRQQTGFRPPGQSPAGAGAGGRHVTPVSTTVVQVRL